MRNLTITRRKSAVGCAMKDRVYIRDEQAREIIIDGVPCRKLGQIKNGETKTFQIGEGEQQIFLIADKLSKDYCNATVTVPAGQEDAVFSGVHKFVYGSNPFRFDGVELSQEEQAKQKKNGRKGAVIMIAAVIFGLIVGKLLVPDNLFSEQSADPETYTKENFQITLTENFKEVEQSGWFAAYESKTAMVFILREAEELIGDMTVEEYGDLVLEANGMTDFKMTKAEDYVWVDYTDTPEEQEIYYMVACFRGEDAYWVINFATPAVNREDYREIFFDWADSVNAG